MFCTNCGKELADSLAFCTNCGTKIGGAPAQETAAPSTSSAPSKSAAPSKAAAPAKAPAPQKAQAPTQGSKEDAKQGKGLLIGVIIAGAAVIIAVAGLLFVLFGPDLQDLFPSSDQQASTAVREPAQSNAENKDEDTAKANEESNSNSSAAATNVEPTPEPQAQDPGYILPESATRLYTTAELEGLSNEELFIARNEIFARYGRGFANEILVQHFNAQPWYTKRYEPADFDAMPSPLNGIERDNVDTIRSIEEARNSSYLA